MLGGIVGSLASSALGGLFGGRGGGGGGGGGNYSTGVGSFSVADAMTGISDNTIGMHRDASQAQIGMTREINELQREVSSSMAAEAMTTRVSQMGDNMAVGAVSAIANNARDWFRA